MHTYSYFSPSIIDYLFHFHKFDKKFKKNRPISLTSVCTAIFYKLGIYCVNGAIKNTIIVAQLHL